MIFDFNTPPIGLVCLDKQIGEFYIPTSRFANPGTEPFAWGAIGQVNFVLMTMAKEPSQNDPSSDGVYMARYWEQLKSGKPKYCIHFSIHWLMLAAGLQDYQKPMTFYWTTRAMLNKNIALNPQFESYVEDFLSNGFPQTTMKNRPTDPQDKVPPQDSIAQHLTDLTDAKTRIMHPKRQEHKTKYLWSFENRPKYTVNFPQMKSRLEENRLHGQNHARVSVRAGIAHRQKSLGEPCLNTIRIITGGSQKG